MSRAPKSSTTSAAKSAPAKKAASTAYPLALSVIHSMRKMMPDEADLSLRQLEILALLDTTKSVRDLAPAVDLPKPTITRAIQRLLDMELVTRERSKLDERLVDVRRTQAGDKLVSSMQAGMTRSFAQAA